MRNLYKRFTDITGRPLKTVATCISTSFGECVVQYPNGSVQTIREAGTIGHRYFIYDNRLDGEAPTLVSLTIEV